MKGGLALALLTTSGVVLAGGVAHADLNDARWQNGMNLWMRGRQDERFHGASEGASPRVHAALRRIERKLDRLAIAFAENEAIRDEHVHRLDTRHPESCNLSERDRRALATADHRLRALTYAIWPIGDELARIARDVAPEGIDAPEVNRVVARAFDLLDEHERRQRDRSYRSCPSCWVEPSVNDEWSDGLVSAAMRCYDLSLARLDLDEMDRCYDMLSRAQPNEYPSGVEVFESDVLWQPSLVTSR